MRLTATRRKVAPRKALGVVRKKRQEFVDVNDPLHLAKALVEKLNQTRDSIKPLKKVEESLGTQIKLWGVGVYPGFTTAVEVLDQPGEGFDMKKFEAEHPALHAQYKTDKPKRVAKSVPLVKG
jgi:hypothetical protein